MQEKMTKYECSSIIGIRAAQLSMSAPMLVDVPQKHRGNFLYIAALELKRRSLDIVIRRPLPLGKFYEINVAELDLPDDMNTLVDMYES